MDTAKLRVKIGMHEFEAEGPSEQIALQFEAWKTLIASSVSTPQPLPNVVLNPFITPNAGSLSLSGNEPQVSLLGSTALQPIFSQDDKRDLVLLRVLPTGEDRHREAVLLILLGYLRLKNIDEVPVIKLKASLQSSGSAPDRIDRAASPSVNDGLLMKSGSGKGGKYRLTNKGISRTEEMAKGLLMQLT